MIDDDNNWDNIYQQIAADILNSKEYKINKDLQNKTAEKLIAAVNKGLSNGEILADKSILAKKLLENVYVFSAAKSATQMKYYRDMMLSEDKAILSKESFVKKIANTGEIFNKKYLEAEYENAYYSTIMAHQWDRYADDDVLEYSTAGDSHVRVSHKLLDKFTASKADSFWKTNYPPNGWGCRCSVIPGKVGEITERQKERFDAGINTLKIENEKTPFYTNVGISAQIFDEDKHPYFKSLSKTELEKVKVESTGEVNEQLTEQKLGITKGKEMTFEEANELKGNINYEKGGGYTINCQSCVVSNELRRRGYDVTALENNNKPNNIPSQLSRKTNWAWLNEKGEIPSKTKVGGSVTDKRGRSKSKSIVKLSNELNDITKETGRYHIDWAWKRGNSGHIITIERLDNGKVRLYDPQNGKIVRWAELSRSISLRHGVNVLRVDNLLLNTDIIDGIVKKL